MNNYLNGYSMPHMYTSAFPNNGLDPQMRPIQMPQITPTSQVQANMLLGKSVDSIDVVKAMDIPLDGSTSYFPLTDGSAIVTKKLQNDGTSKTVVYKPVDDEKKEEIKFATFEDIQDAINEIDLSDIQDLKDDVKEIKKQLKEMKTRKSKDD